MNKNMDLVILTTANDMRRVMRLYYKYPEMVDVRHIVIIGNLEVGELVKELNDDRFVFRNEEELITFEAVRQVLQQIFKGQNITRGFTGWYYQQFLKMEYSRQCKDDWYLCWDGDTIPVQKIEMFSPEGIPYIDWKREYNPSYFRTLASVFPGMKKVVEMSFVSEHMLFSVDIMKEMLEKIEASDHLTGESFWERILRTVDEKDLNGQGFSEFETYGTYVAYYHSDRYKMRHWFSWRLCGTYFSPTDITEEEMEWLGKDFSAISFEKGQEADAAASFLRDPQYRRKLTAKQMIRIIQEYAEGWKENLD